MQRSSTIGPNIGKTTIEMTAKATRTSKIDRHHAIHRLEEPDMRSGAAATLKRYRVSHLFGGTMISREVAHRASTYA